MDRAHTSSSPAVPRPVPRLGPWGFMLAAFAWWMLATLAVAAVAAVVFDERGLTPASFTQATLGYAVFVALIAFTPVGVASAVLAALTFGVLRDAPQSRHVLAFAAAGAVVGLVPEVMAVGVGPPGSFVLLGAACAALARLSVWKMAKVDWAEHFRARPGVAQHPPAQPQAGPPPWHNRPPLG